MNQNLSALVCNGNRHLESKLHLEAISKKRVECEICDLKPEAGAIITHEWTLTNVLPWIWSKSFDAYASKEV